MQNAGIAALGLDWRYLAFDVDPNDLPQAIVGAAAMKYVGLNLTVPHKLLAYDLVDELDESARTWGAVNTIRFEGRNESGEWTPMRDLPIDYTGDIRTHGFNTDADAIIRALQDDLGVEPRGAKIVLLGAGGAGRVAALRLAAEHVGELFLINRTTEKAEAVRGEIANRFPEVKASVGYPQDGAADVVLNATSLGLKEGDGSPLDESSFPITRATHYYDMIYRPAETPFLRRANESGAKTANGLGMLLYQGAAALAIWAGKEPEADVMREALKRNVYGE
ncbi:MAG: shikimate dehydrogenase [Verrucomicrobiales bacterium]|nr:shikimate dehydrogenase [Verrucomicrobiales bacterium]